jgi:rRNA maturation endonuclease Nob1
MKREEIKEIIREVLRETTPKDFCYVCGNKEITIHHLRIEDIKSKKNKGKVRGTIYLCENCHRIVEDIVNKGKSKKLWYERGYDFRGIKK